MRLIRGLHNLIVPLSGSLVTIGNFDGVHLGHQQLIHCLAKHRDQHQLPIVVITFEPQPKEFFAKQQAVPRIMRLTEKYRVLQALGVDYLCCLYFNDAFASLSAQDFVTDILLKRLNMRVMVVGHDFHFGAKRQGDFDLLRQLAAHQNFEVAQIPPITLDDGVVSSTRLRDALCAGDMSLVTRLLGRPYCLWGKVCYGRQRGRDLGFPTANINLHRDIVPLHGVFVVRAKWRGNSVDGVANVGVRPTFHGTRVLLEVHLLDFSDSIYGENLQVEFLHKIRDEKRYDKFEALVTQIREDVQQARAYFCA